VACLLGVEVDMPLFRVASGLLCDVVFRPRKIFHFLVCECTVPSMELSGLATRGTSSRLQAPSRYLDNPPTAFAVATKANGEVS